MHFVLKSLWSPSGWNSSLVFLWLLLMLLKVAASYFLRCPLTWGVQCFLMNRLKLCILAGISEGMVSPHHVLSGACTSTLSHYCQWSLLSGCCPPAFSTLKLLFSSLSLVHILWRGALKLCKYSVSHQTFNIFICLFVST